MYGHRREDGRPQTLDMTVRVTRDRTDVMGGHHPPSVAADPPEDQDDTEVRQLIVGQAHRPPAQLVEDLVERVAMDRRRQAIADRGGPDRQPGGGPPGIDRQVIGELRGDEQRGIRLHDRPDGGGSRDAGPAELGRLGQPLERLRRSGQLLHRRRRRHEIAQRPEEGRLAGTPRPHRRPRTGRPPRPAARSSPPARNRACRARSARRWCAVPVERGGRPTGPAQGRCRPRGLQRSGDGWVGPAAYGRAPGASNRPVAGVDHSDY